MPPKLSLGLNLPKKPQQQQQQTKPKPNLAAGQKRKNPIFDTGSDEEDDINNGANNGDKNVGGGEIEISSVGGLEIPVTGAEDEELEQKEKEESTRHKRKQPSKKNTPEQPPTKRKPGKPLNKNSIFADDDETGGTSDSIPGMGMGMEQNTTNNNNNPYTNLSTLHTTKKHIESAQDLDPTIYAYDSVYDSIHAKPTTTTSTDAHAQPEKPPLQVPKYMTSLLRSAEIRKRDQLRARDRMLAKEREAEGDEFADKEKFVTSAYKAQQAEMRRVEEEDAQREREEEERRRQNGGAGMVNFYRDVLARGEERHAEAVRAAEETARLVKAGEKPMPGSEAEAEAAAAAEAEEKRKEAEGTKEKSEAQVAAELNARGANIAVNDEGQVVDKRQLLSAGLNVAPKPKPSPSAQNQAASAKAPRPFAARPGGGAANDPQSSRAAVRSRQTDMIASQLEEKARQAEEAEAARQRELAERNRSRKTDGEVSSARERYLARKKEREEAERKK